MSTPAGRRVELTLHGAFVEFRRWPSARTLATAVVATAIARLAVGGWSTRDLWIPLLMLAAYPLVEWCIHVLLLHFKPRRLAGWHLDPLVARKHRAHHADPTAPELIFIPMPVLWQLLGGSTLIAWLAFAELRHGLTFLLTVTTIALVYEWTHHLVHTTYRPRTAVYRALWRHHRLHHYKNEHYWFGVVTTAADHALRTRPDPTEVPRSPTARDLHGRGADVPS